MEGSKIFQTLFVLRFLDFNNVAQLMQSGFSKELIHKKDVLYDFLKNENVCWRSIMLLFFKQIYKVISKKSEESTDTACFVVDDSKEDKTGKKIEFIGKVHDHCSHSYSLAFKVLTLGYTDGKTFLPLNFSLHSEAGKNGKRGLKDKDLAKQYTKERASKSAGFERASEVFQDKITMALKMIKQSLKSWLKVNYVLADSWFICEKFIKEVKEINSKLNVIGLMKMNRTIEIEGKKYKTEKIPVLMRKRIKESRKFKCTYISLKMNYKEIEIRGYWIKMNGQESWNLLISTDIKLGFVKAMEIYKQRWSIEVFFKDCKQNLGLNSCQSKDFDAHIAHNSIVFMNYMILALKKRFEDYETFGILFRNFKDLMLKQTVVHRMWNILFQLFDTVFVFLGVDFTRFFKMLINKQDEILQNLNIALNPLYPTEQRIA